MPALDPQAAIPADPSAASVAAVYAKGLLGAVGPGPEADEALGELDLLVKDVLDKQPAFAAVLASPRIDPQDKAAMLERVFAGKMKPILLNFLKVLARRRRLDLLRQIARAAAALRSEALGRVPAILTTAAPVDAATAREVRDRLSAALAKDVQLTTRVDASLIGGLVVRVGDQVYDGSVLSRLNRLRQTALTSAVSQAQASLDRFVRS